MLITKCYFNRQEAFHDAGINPTGGKNRLRQDGKNELAEAPKSKPVRMFLGQFRDVMVMILLAATMVSVLLGEWTDAITIILIVLLNAILGFIQEFRTERTLETLRQMTAPTAAVCRDGTWQTISAAELVRVTSSGWKPATVFRQMLPS